MALGQHISPGNLRRDGIEIRLAALPGPQTDIALNLLLTYTPHLTLHKLNMSRIAIASLVFTFALALSAAAGPVPRNAETTTTTTDAIPPPAFTFGTYFTRSMSSSQSLIRIAPHSSAPSVRPAPASGALVWLPADGDGLALINATTTGARAPLYQPKRAKARPLHSRTQDP
ncbi:hypothetical protein ONZ51_g766 [Trametes cubensis]|uniref:Uncharacterized protein n=1 Tax=Trametes cubensis TaxID=1111947 RepID=A0AAD7U2T3_9APHY|nr:hypothetical protein ONZ51_g766 [Trametes cubensis]